jgi:hypothetical protein
MVEICDDPSDLGLRNRNSYKFTEAFHEAVSVYNVHYMQICQK